MAGLRFELLGQPRVLREGHVLDIGPGKQRAVLAVLLLHANHPVDTNTIIDAVWPDDPPANGPNVVQKHVAGLRKILEPQRSPRTPGMLLTRTDAGYQLTVEHGTFDLAEFHANIARARTEPDALAVRTLRTATALWRGPALAGLDGAVFDVERARLTEAMANAVEERIDRELRQGLHAQAVPELVALTARHPYRERLRGQLMLALYRSGRQADALTAFRDGRRLLNEELGIEPGDALRVLHDQILAAAPTLTVQSGHTSPGPAASGPTAPPPYQPPPYQPPPWQPPPASAPPPSWQAPPRPARGVDLTGWWLVAGPFLSVGLLTWAAFLVAAIRLRGWLLWSAVVVYATITVLAFIFKDITTVSLIMLVPWFGGTVHGFVVRPRLRGFNDPVVAQARKNQGRRAEARRLAATNPGLARDLRIGRPDLIRDYDDGGLVDVNAVPEEVLCDAAGFSKEQAIRIAGDRDLVGGFGSVGDLVARGLVDRLTAEAVRDRLIFLR